MDLNLLRTYVTVIDSGSMTQAAKALKQPISRVSRAISRLESQLGQSLILRTTRSFQVTDAGKKLFTETRPLLQKVMEVQTRYASQNEKISGLIRLTAPEDIGGTLLSRFLAELSQLHPNLVFELNFTDEMVDLVKTGTDIGVRIGQLRDSSLKAKRLGKIDFICVASPFYLDKTFVPRKPQDLLKHQCIHLILGPQDHRKGWKLTNGPKTEHVSVPAQLHANHTGTVIELAKAHRGVALVPAPLVIDVLQKGDLIRVLPGWSLTSLPVHLIYPPQRIVSQKVRAVADYLEEKLKPYFT